MDRPALPATSPPSSLFALLTSPETIQLQAIVVGATTGATTVQYPPHQLHCWPSILTPTVRKCQAATLYHQSEETSADGEETVFKKLRIIDISQDKTSLLQNFKML